MSVASCNLTSIPSLNLGHSSQSYHAAQRVGPALQAPHVQLPPAYLPSYLTASTSKTPVAAPQPRVQKSKARTPSMAPESSQAERNTDEDVAKLHNKVLDAAPGSKEAREIFKLLPAEIEALDLRPIGQVKFVAELCKAVWMKRLSE